MQYASDVYLPSYVVHFNKFRYERKIGNGKKKKKADCEKRIGKNDAVWHIYVCNEWRFGDIFNIQICMLALLQFLLLLLFASDCIKTIKKIRIGVNYLLIDGYLCNRRDYD